MQMNLLAESREVLPWLARVFVQFLRVQPRATIAIVAASTSSMIASLLAFFIPLKVILLAGSPGVPRYFFFIDPDRKAAWIIGLAIASVAAYGLTLVLSSTAERLQETASSRVLGQANELAQIRRQREKGQTFYGKACTVVSQMAFAACGLVALFLVDGRLFMAVIALIAAFYLVTAGILAKSNLLAPAPLVQFILRRTNEYLKIGTSVGFLAGFLVILVPFLTDRSGNILSAILSIILLRLVLNNVAGAVGHVMALARARPQVDPLVFREHQMKPRDLPEDRVFRHLFQKHEREQMISRVLSTRLEREAVVESEWQDSTIPGARVFRIRATKSNGIQWRQLQVFPSDKAHLLDREELLFLHVDRRAVCAPAVVARFSAGAFECQICEAGDGPPFVGRKWPGINREINKMLWSFVPPKSLISAFESARPSLPGRLTEELLCRLKVATDSPLEVRELELLLDFLPTLQARLERVPRYVHNSDLEAPKVCTGPDGPLVMTWCRWSIEPIGFSLPPLRDETGKGELLQALQWRSRGACALQDAELVNRCRDLEDTILGMRYKRALSLVGEILVLARQQAVDSRDPDATDESDEAAALLA